MGRQAAESLTFYLIYKITAIDTRPFLRPAAVSPASSETIYHANAESYLEIGQAIGEGILGLIKDDPAQR